MHHSPDRSATFVVVKRRHVAATSLPKNAELSVDTPTAHHITDWHSAVVSDFIGFLALPITRKRITRKDRIRAKIGAE